MLGDVHPGDLEHFVEVSVEDVEVDKVLPTRKIEKNIPVIVTMTVFKRYCGLTSSPGCDRPRFRVGIGPG